MVYTAQYISNICVHNKCSTYIDKSSVVSMFKVQEEICYVK